MAQSRSRTNDQTAWALLAVLFLSPIPFGSNRPFFWCLWAAFMGALLAWHTLSSLRVGSSYRLRLTRLYLIGGLFWLTALQTIFQVIPLGTVDPFVFNTANDEHVTSIYLSLTPGDSWLSLLRWLTYGVLFVLIAEISVREKRAQRILFWISALVAMHAAYALLALTQFGDTILFFEKTYYSGVATGTFVNRNALATFLGIGAVVSFSATLSTDRKVAKVRSGWNNMTRERTLAALFLIVSLAALLATQSRMGLLATLFGLATVLFFELQLQSSRLRGLLLSVVALGVVSALYGTGVAERLYSVQESLSERYALYRQVGDMIAARPFFGYGVGSFEYAYPLFHQLPVSTSRTWEYAHSMYLAVVVERGVLFGLAPIFSVLLILWQIFRCHPRNGQRQKQRSAAIGSAVVVAMHSLVDFSLHIEAVALLFVAVLALAYSAVIASPITVPPGAKDERCDA